MARRLLLVGALLLFPIALLTPPASAPTGRIIHVDCTNTSGIEDGTPEHPYDTIQEGIDAASDGDTVLAAPCTYRRISFLGKAITVTSVDPYDPSVVAATIISGASGFPWENTGNAVRFDNGEGSESVLRGFTVRDGHGVPEAGYVYGGGIHCYHSSPTISNNVIIENSAISKYGDEWGYGGGIYCHYSAATITDNFISANKARYGGGIYCDYSSPTIMNNTIAGNITTLYAGGAGICCRYSSSPMIANNIIIGNTALSSTQGGGGVFCVDASPTIANNAIIANTAALGGGILCQHLASPVISNNIVAFNSSGIHQRGDSTPTLGSNCVHNPGGTDYVGLEPGPGDISADPKIVALEYGMVHVQPGSPCIDAGDDSVVQPGWTDMDGQARIQGSHVDIGADESDGTWHDPSPPVVRTAPWGDDRNDGTSWPLAKQTLQGAIAATSALGGGEVWVAAGSYHERITLRAFVHVYGGFAGTEAARHERDWGVNLTVLDGSAGGSVVTAIALPQFCTVDGFTIRNGTGTRYGDDEWGGGIYCADSSLAIRNNTISANSATWGGGVNCDGSSPTLSNNIITGNSAEYGGGVHCLGGTPTLCGNIITANGADHGAGFYSDLGTAPTICNNTVVGNSAAFNAGGMYFWRSSAIVSNNIVAFNSSGMLRSDSTVTLRNNCVYNPDSYDYSGLDPGEGDICADPLFLDRARRDYHLTAASPCVNSGWNEAAGLPATDMDGEPRIQGGVVDIGADELPPITLCFTLRGECWHRISLPCHPLDPDPWQVFDELRPPNQPLDLLSGCVHRYDHDGRTYVTYWHTAPSEFGPITPGQGYLVWLFDDVTICYGAQCPAEPQVVSFTTPGWYMMGTPQPTDIYLDDTRWYQDATGPYSFGEIMNLWVQDPLVGWICELGRYYNVGLLPWDEDHYLRAFQGYWLYAFEPGLTMEVLPP